MVRSATWVGWSRSLLAALIAAVVTLLGVGAASVSPDGELHLVNKDGSVVIPTGVYPEP